MQRFFNLVVLEHTFEHVAVGAREVDIDPRSEVFRQFLEITAIGVGQNQFHDLAATRGDNLFPDAPDRQHLPDSYADETPVVDKMVECVHPEEKSLWCGKEDPDEKSHRAQHPCHNAVGDTVLDKMGRDRTRWLGIRHGQTDTMG